jgi:peptide/nickel transport system permease protein
MSLTLSAPVAPADHSAFASFLKEFAANRIALVALCIAALFLLASLLAPWITPQNPYDLAHLSMRDLRLPPGSVGTGGYVHLLGTDQMGRDLLSAIIYGMRISLQVGFISGFVSLTIGMTLGLLAAYHRGLVGALIMRVVDLQLSFPAILLALTAATLLGQGRWQVIVSLVAAQYAYFARAAYGAAVTESSKEYIEAAIATPLPARTILIRHLVPNCLPPVIVIATIEIASAISLEATLSFLGLGLPMNSPSLGTLIANGFQFMLSGRYWISVYPGIFLVVLILSINLVGDQLRDQLNPRLRR